MLDLVVDNFSRARRRLIVAATLGSAALVALPAAASAQQVAPTDAAYGSTIDLISRGGDTPDRSATADLGSLPFTGFDVAVLAAVAAGLVLVGFVLRRYRNTELDVR